MSNGEANGDRRIDPGQDQDWTAMVNWDLGLGGSYRGNTVWKCDAMRAGRLYNRMLFSTREEAEKFARNMREAEPDQMFSVEAIKASTVWN